MFPKDFLWGVATASYQIEGSVNKDGRKPSIWDTFSHIPGNTLNGDTGDVACDHYNRYKEDVALLKQYGIKTYRFSIAWPRIFPDGSGEPNEMGMQFYIDLVDELLANDIKPIVTLYHWDLPQALQEHGGWTNREIVDHFVTYANYVFDHLGDKVYQWITLNEPWVVAMLGYYTGEHAPGIKDLPTALDVVHHLFLAHGETVKLYRTKNLKAQIGITLNVCPKDPASDAPEDVEATERMHAFANSWYLEPIFKGTYPQNLVDWYKKKNIGLPNIQMNDMDTISQPIDFLGINYYTRAVVKEGNDLFGAENIRPEGEYTAMDWEVYPQGLYDILSRIHHDYNGPDIYITENGAAYDDVRTEDNHIHDKKRTTYLQEHFKAAHQAIQDGIALKGYYVWSFMDNFEWACGYSKRFGLTYIDYETQERIIKDSGLWYKQVIRNNAF
jgi:beta-glucosidase